MQISWGVSARPTNSLCSSGQRSAASGRCGSVRFTLAALACSSALVPAGALAQDGVTLLERVEVKGGLSGGDSGYKAGTSSAATKTPTPLKQTPQSIQVLPRKVLDDEGVRSVDEALRNVSAAQGTNPLQTPAFNSTLVRGFPAEQFLDGFSTFYNGGDPNSLVNLERIEVLKGPNAILYGGGSGTPLGGIVNLVSKLPTEERFVEIGGTIGSHGYYQPFFDINQPLNADGTILFRGTGTYVWSGSEIDTIDTKRFSLNPTLVFTNKDTTTLTLQGRWSEWEQPEYQGLPTIGTVAGDFRIRRDLFIGTPDIPDSFSKTKGITATLDHAFNDTWSSTTKLRYGETDFREYVQLIFGNSPDATPSSWYVYNTDLSQKQEEFSAATQVLGEFSTEGATHKLLLGADYSRLSDVGAMLVDFNPLGPIDLQNPGAYPAYTQPMTIAMSDGDNRYTTSGAFAQIQSSFHERLHLLGGVRLASLDIDQVSPSYMRTDRTRETRLLPRVGAVFDLTNEFSVYASYSQGMKGNPFVFYSGTPKPEFSEQSEAGVKFDLPSGLSGSLAVFQIDRENVPIVDPADLYGLTAIPDGRQRSRGFEADLVWQPNAGWSVIANYAYVDAVLVEGSPGGAAPGSRLNYIPRHSGGVWANYDFKDGRLEGWNVGGGFHAQSSSFVDLNNLYRTGGFVTFDAALGYKRDGFSASLFVKNLTDEEYFVPFRYLDGRVAPGEGRSVQLTVSQKF